MILLDVETAICSSKSICLFPWAHSQLPFPGCLCSWLGAMRLYPTHGSIGLGEHHDQGQLIKPPMRASSCWYPSDWESLGALLKCQSGRLPRRLHGCTVQGPLPADLELSFT